MRPKTKEEVLEQFRCTSIEDAAIAVIARKGLGEATMQAIAEEAGIAKGTIYVYFRDREELLTRAAARAYEQLVAELSVAFNAPGTLEERLMAVTMRQLRFFDENRELFHAHMALTQRTPPLRRARPGAYGQYVQSLEQLFTEGKERGEVGDVDAREIAEIYSDCIRGVIIRRIEDKSKTPHEQQAAVIVSMLLRGIRRSE
jgi:AcrR family transcriptional regulator